MGVRAHRRVWRVPRCSQVTLVLRERSEGTVLVVQPPCRLKTCDECWSREAERLKGLLTSTFEQCRICSTIPFSYGINATFFGAFKRWAERNQRLWFASPLEDGELLTLVEGDHRDGARVLDVPQTVEYAINNHDRGQRLRASHRIKLSGAKVLRSPWQLITTTRTDAERIFLVAMEMGLDVQWLAPDRLRILATNQELQDLVGRVA